MQNVQKLQKSFSELALNPSGYSIVRSQTLTQLSASLIKDHMSSTLAKTFDNLREAATFVAANNFSEFKDKPNRILPQESVNDIISELSQLGFINPDENEFITDEENIGYPNIYWRIVRPNHESDVGPVHADKWFWDLGDATLPRGFERTKIWTPLIQDDSEPSLMLVPGSQKLKYEYGFKQDEFNKKKPTFYNPQISSQLIPAPVCVGESVVFHDNLLHGGRTTQELRVSVEMTLAHPSRIVRK